MQRTLLQFGCIGLMTLLVITGCHKKTEQQDNASAASAAETQAVSMSAAPADNGNNPPVINETTATLDAGPEAVASSTKDTLPASVTEAEASDEGDVDNSAMDKITENDKVIDNEPASPNAPRANDMAESRMGNAKVGQ